MQGTIPVDKSLLQIFITQAAAADSELYTTESISALNVAAGIGNQALTSSDQTVIDTAATGLENALNSLNQEKKVLENAIKAVEALKQADYTRDTWTTLVNKLDDAKSVYENANATKEEIDAAAQGLQSAIDEQVLRRYIYLDFHQH
jgi:hypothetical protein